LDNYDADASNPSIIGAAGSPSGSAAVIIFHCGSLSASQKNFFVLAATSHDAPTKHATIGARG
jgi:hypothetical protein